MVAVVEVWSWLEDTAGLFDAVDAVAARTKEVEEWDQWATLGRSRGLRLKPWLRLPIAESMSVQSATAVVG